MVEIRSFAELLADLGRLGSSFRSLIAYPGEDSIKHWCRLREDGNTILNHMRYHSAINRMGLFKSVPKFERLGVNGASARSCYLDNDPLFKGLVGFELEPRYRSFKAERMTIFLDGSRFTRELCFSSGLIFQPVIAVDPEIASDPGKLWIEHKFELLDRCARGCEMLIDIIEKEMAPPQQAEHADDGDGLFQDDRILVWGGVKFTLTTNQAVIFRLLVDAYPGDVTHGSFEDKRIGVFRDSFRFSSKERKKRGYDYYPCWGVIADGSAKDSKRLIDPSIVRSDPKRFQVPNIIPIDPQGSPE